MHLQRVQVPDFRALKNVDITFEQERIPRIFPLASQNGGGKSTLLQLIFALLACSANETKHQYLKNILKDFPGKHEDSDLHVLAVINLINGEEHVNLKFTCLQTDKLIDRYYQSADTKKESKLLEALGFSKCFLLFEQTNKELESLEEKIDRLQDINLERLIREIDSDMSYPADFYLTPDLNKAIDDLSENRKNEKYYADYRYQRDFSIKDLKRILRDLSDELSTYLKKEKELRKENNDLTEARDMARQVIDMTQSEQLKYICSYDTGSQVEHSLFCQIIGDNEKTDFLDQVSQKVFLATTGSQVLLFFERKIINLLFSRRESWQFRYEQEIRKIQESIPGLFLHDFSVIKILTEAFKSAIERDGRQAIQSRGQYGGEFAKILEDLTNIFSEKMIEPLEDLSGIVVKTVNGDMLYPEDLSHGELRRLTFYAWLKTKEIQDAIVLVDEIEIGLHPDWQYQIVKDLEDWAPSNQYILATHSYDVCSALTPTHVKEIAPKLTKKSAPSAN